MGGPSLKSMDLSPLSKRGMLLISTNNCLAALPPGIRPTIWIHTDPTHKFHDSIWKDPAILKFSPTREWCASMNEEHPKPPANPKRWHPKGVRQRGRDSALEFIPFQRACDFPGTIGYARNTAFDPEIFLHEPSINRGNDKKHGPKVEGDAAAGCRANGWPHCINTMFSVLRLAFFLGIRTVYLLGCDFRMDHKQPYAFDQGKNYGGVGGNNNAYANMAGMLAALRPKFEAEGFNVLNCTPGSGLWAFDLLDYGEAVARATAGIEQVLDTRNWYDGIS